MLPRDPQVILQKLGQASLKVDSFFLRRTGFIANQTILKLGEYNLNCVPATLGLGEAQFLAVLTPSEVNLFGKFKEGTHILILTFDDPDKHDVARFPLRVGLSNLESIPERKNVCLLTLKLKNLPAEFVLFLGEYLEAMEGRRETWETLAGKTIQMTPELAVGVGAGFGFVLVKESSTYSVSIQGFDTKTVHLHFQDALTLPAEGAGAHLRLSFQGRPFQVDGTLTAEGVLVTDFSPDWLAFVEECHFQESMAHRKSGTTPK